MSHSSVILPGHLKLIVHADAKQEKLLPKAGDRFEVWVKEPAQAGRANRAVLTLVAQHLKIPMGRLWLVKGAHSPSKIVEIRRGT